MQTQLFILQSAGTNHLHCPEHATGKILFRTSLLQSRTLIEIDSAIFLHIKVLFHGIEIAIQIIVKNILSSAIHWIVSSNYQIDKSFDDLDQFRFVTPKITACARDATNFVDLNDGKLHKLLDAWRIKRVHSLHCNSQRFSPSSDTNTVQISFTSENF